ncbi:MAG: HAD family hydrolase [Candidatus Bathyarchaeia archaeon]
MFGIRVVSFDLEGTLVDMAFSEMVWNEGLPRLYAQKVGLDFSEAKRVVLEEYMRVGEDNVEWYDIEYWFRRFGLSNPERLLEAYKGFIRLFPETVEVLKTVSRNFQLILTTNSNILFIKVLANDIAHFFNRIFSATSDFGLLKRNPETYRRICKVMGVKPCEMAHVGDRLLDDFKSPRSLGIRSYFLNRTGGDSQAPAKFTVRNLKDFANLLLASRSL